MKRARKGLAALLAMILIVCLAVTGCGGSNDSNGNDEAGNANGANGETSGNQAETDDGVSGSAVDLEPYTVKFLYPGGNQKDVDMVQKAMNKILKEKINASVEITPIDWGQWENKVNLMVASRESYDVIFTAQWNGHAVNVSKGALLPLNDDKLDRYGNLLQQHGQGILETMDPTFFEGAALNGLNYGVPTNKELAAQGGMVYRSDIAEELGIDMSVVKSVTDLPQVLEIVKAKKPEMIPLFFRIGDNFMTHYFSGFDTLGDSTIPGVLLKDEPGTTVKSKLELDRYKDLIHLTRDFMKKGYLNKDAATTTISSQDAMKAGNVFMIPQSLKPGKADEMANSIGLVGKLKQIELTPATVSTAEPAGSMLGISSTSKDPERAMMFINLLHTDKELNNLLNFGIEGIHYEKVSDNIIKATDKTGDYAPGSAWMFGNQFLNYLWDNEDPEKWEKFKVFNSSAKKSPGLGFTFNAEPVKTEVAAISNIVKEFDEALDNGAVEPDEYIEKFADRLNKAGLQKVLKEKQKQLDAFLESKKQ